MKAMVRSGMGMGMGMRVVAGVGVGGKGRTDSTTEAGMRCHTF